MAEQPGYGEGYIKQIIKTVLTNVQKECHARGESVSDTLVAFVVKALLLNPQNKFEGDELVSEPSLNAVVKRAVDWIMDKEGAAMDTIKMQVYFDTNYVSRKTFFKEHRGVLKQSAAGVLREILDSRARTVVEMDALYRKVLTYILLKSSLGSSTDMVVLRETTAALQSVLPQSEVGTLLPLSREQKQNQLNELTLVVTGIRLFNKTVGKGGVGIVDVTEVLADGLPAATDRAAADVEEIEYDCFKITALAEHIAKPSNIEARREEYERCIEAIANLRQRLAFARLISDAIEESSTQVYKNLGQYRQKLQEMQTVVKSSRSVATAEVYPKFRDLALAWGGMQEEMVFLGVLEGMAAGLSEYCKVFLEDFADDKLEADLDLSAVKTDAMRADENSADEAKISGPLGEQVRLFEPKQVINFSAMQTEFKGFCAYSLAVGQGLLIPGDPNIGILSFNGLYYSFSSKEAATDFSYAPYKFISTITELCRERAYLIPLLSLHSKFSGMAPKLGPSSATLSKPVTRCDAGIQTDVHAPTMGGIDRSYEWNEWILRSQAIKLANIRQKVTHSTQTTLSYHRRDADTQVYLPKEQTTQTRRQKNTDVPKPAVYVAGLRGSEQNMAQPAKYDLTPSIHIDKITEDLEPKYLNPDDL
ncbi:cilia- and flagella-associated protein 206-like [Sycon ciliatum]|uniref:cilia- and flagella-associated protein 206-like n=1 Tax=Sycon ciliatum TaxID=27933 RepID=UPI0031F66A18